MITKPTSLAFKVSYNNIDSYNGPLGQSWTHNYDLRLTLNETGRLDLKTGDDNIIYFNSSSGTYYPEARSGDTSTIVRNGDNTYTRRLKDGSVQTFNSAGRLTSLIDRNNNTTTLTYNGNDLIAITDSTGRALTITVNDGRIASITDPAGTIYSFTYANNLLTAVTFADSALGTLSWSYTYDTNGNMLTKADPAGFASTNVYDADRKLISATDTNGLVKTTVYEQANNKATYTEKDSGVWIQTYDSNLNLPLTKTDPLGNVTRYTYDTKGNMLTKTDPDGSVTTYAYDGNNNITSVRNALNQTTTYTYNAFGQVTSIVDSKGTIAYAYDAKGNLLSMTDPIGAVTHYQYDSKGNITSITDPLGHVTSLAYDQYNNPITITNPQGAITQFAYDILGNLTSKTDAQSNIATIDYNSRNLPIRITDPKGYITNYAYDANGNRTSVTDANGKTTFYDYNYKGKVIQIRDALNGITTMDYGSTGCPSCTGGGDKLTALIDARGYTTQYEYDLLGRPTKETDPLGKMTSYTYDAKGNLASKTDANGHTITYSYDSINRLITKTYPNNATTTFTYDSRGNILTAANENISYTFTYDANNRMTRVVDSNGRTIQYQYNAAGKRSSMTTPEGDTINYTYDVNNLLNSIQSGTGMQVGIIRDTLGRKTRLNYSSGVSTAYSYDNNGRLANIATNGIYEHDGLSLTYQYDKTINRTVATDLLNPNEIHHYTYDNVYQLTAATHAAQPSEQYAYDLMGNRTSTTANNVNQLISDGTYTYSYDNNGNMVSRTTVATGEVRTFTWDSENRLIGIEDSELQAEYKYDPFGRRIQTIYAGGIEWYVYDGANVISQYDNYNDCFARFIHGDGIDEPLARITDWGEVQYYHADGLGSIISMTSSWGTVLRTVTYDSFGNILTLAEDPWFEQLYGFAGREFDPHTGLYFNRARYYDPKIGRFISKDPIGLAGGINLYAYVKNNPVNWFDPLGLASLIVKARNREGSSGGSSDLSSSNTGHGWVTIINDDGTSVTIGNFPGGPSNSDTNRVPSVLYSWDVSQAQANAAYNAMNLPGYSFSNDNCVDRVIAALDAAGIDHPGFDTWGISDPNKLANWINSLGKKKDKPCQ